MSAARIWLIGGTSESAALAGALAKAGIPYVVTVTTAAAQRLYSKTAQVWVGQLSAQSIDVFIQRWQVRCILDASHPFASEISRLAIATAERLSSDRSFRNQETDRRLTSGQTAITYIRYERDVLCSQPCSPQPCSPQSSSSQSCSPNETVRPQAAIDKTITFVRSIETLLESGALEHQRVLFTMGYRQLLQFAPDLARLRQQSQLFARVLPSVPAISGAIAAGFSAQEIMAIRPPISMVLEKALWQQWQISTVVAKASGVAGGEGVKRAIALELGVRLILIERPPLNYPKQTNLMSEAIEFCSETLRLY